MAILLSGSEVRAQGLRIATYNVENLGDTTNNPGIEDPLLTPAQYRTKIENLRRVVADLGADILALCEVENRAVVEDLVRGAPSEYAVVHYDSPDRRGIDVALAYRTDRLRLIDSYPISAPGGYPTRDVLCVELIDTRLDTLVAYVMHLPSRRGASAAAAKARAMIATTVAAQVLAQAPTRSVVVMGDMNENPNSSIVRRALGRMDCTTLGPWRRGVGSYAWRDSWLMYDNILVRLAPHLVTAGEARVFAPEYLLTAQGRYKGYPLRGEYSDHLPIFIELNRR